MKGDSKVLRNESMIENSAEFVYKLWKVVCLCVMPISGSSRFVRIFMMVLRHLRIALIGR